MIIHDVNLRSEILDLILHKESEEEILKELETWDSDWYSSQDVIDTYKDIIK